MKKLVLFLSILLSSLAVMGCDFFLLTTHETTEPTSTIPDPFLEAAFTLLETDIPSAIIADFTLPVPEDDAIGIAYEVDGVSIDRTLVYGNPSGDRTVILTVTLSYLDRSLTRTYEVLLIRDPQAYETYLVNQTFAAIDEAIATAMPTTIVSDFTLPDVRFGTAYIAYSVDQSRIFHSRFVFTFPTRDTAVVVTAHVRYAGETRLFEYTVVMRGFSSLPRIPELRIWTSGNRDVTSKDDYITGFATLVTYDQNNVQTAVFENRPLQIRGRGNSTWAMPKKPYRIKFDTKTAMFTEYDAKDWVLLANYMDHTLIRNYLAYTLADDMGMEATPSATFVDLYLNNVYLGNYMISDQVEVSSVRVPIEEHSAATDTGYLVELDWRQDSWPDATEGVDMFRVYGYPYVIKSPQTDDDVNPLSSSQFNYIKSFFTTVHETLANRRDYTAYIDEASFIDWFIVQEVFKNVDSGYSSVFMYKDMGGVLKMGPVWDFDLSSTNPGHLDATNRAPEGWYTSLEYKNIFFYYLMKYPTFRAHLQERWNEVYEPHVLTMLDSVYPISDGLARSRYLNFQKWDIIGKNWDWYTSQEVYDAKTYEEQTGLLYDWLEARIEWMNEAINASNFV